MALLSSSFRTTKRRRGQRAASTRKARYNNIVASFMQRDRELARLPQAQEQRHDLVPACIRSCVCHRANRCRLGRAARTLCCHQPAGPPRPGLPAGRACGLLIDTEHHTPARKQCSKVSMHFGACMRSEINILPPNAARHENTNAKIAPPGRAAHDTHGRRVCVWGVGGGSRDRRATARRAAWRKRRPTWGRPRCRAARGCARRRRAARRSTRRTWTPTRRSRTAGRTRPWRGPPCAPRECARGWPTARSAPTRRSSATTRR